MKRFLFFAFFTVCILPDTEAESAVRSSLPPVFVPHFLWGGSWESEKNLSDRFQFTLDMPVPDLSFRLQLTDRRPAGSFETFADSFSGNTETAPLTSLSGAAYHQATDSRFLYGMIATSGLAARIKNPWIRGSPFMENHLPSQSDLRTETSSTALPAFFAYLGSPDFVFPVKQAEDSENPKLRLFGAFSLESTGESGSSFSFSGGKPAFTFGTDFSIFEASARLETYFTEGTIPPRKASAWFSAEPALPERVFRLYAGSFTFNLPDFGLAADAAYSETFAYGEGFYGNIGLRFGNRPWRFSLASDGSGSRYVGPDGGESSAGFRLAARLERRGRLASLLRFDALYRSNETEKSLVTDFWELAENPNRYSFGAYYRFPATKDLPRFKVISLKASGDSRDAEKETGSAEALVGLWLWQINSDTQIKLSGFKNKDEGGYQYESFRLHESVIWNNDFLQVRAALGFTAPVSKAAVWDTSLAATVKVKPGWVKLKLDSPVFPEQWVLTLSWLGKW